MLTETRKQREIREREARILDVAKSHLLHGGYLGLSMDRIAAEMQYSKGTIYQHFHNKEEILLALANDAQQKRSQMFATAAATAGTPRQRAAAIAAAAEVFVERFSHYFMVEQIVRISSIWEKTSDERRHVMRTCETRCMAIVAGIVRDGVASGDLTLGDGLQPEDVVFGMWSLYLGAQTILASSDSLQEIGIRNGGSALRHNVNRMLDGHRWSPLSGEFDYSAHIDRIKNEVFSNE
ncbi:MAG: TetR/AcrR family transcriptional regulator [Planctomycetota bacterium]